MDCRLCMSSLSTLNLRSPTHWSWESSEVSKWDTSQTDSVASDHLPTNAKCSNTSIFTVHMYIVFTYDDLLNLTKIFELCVWRKNCKCSKMSVRQFFLKIYICFITWNENYQAVFQNVEERCIWERGSMRRPTPTSLRLSRITMNREVPGKRIP